MITRKKYSNVFSVTAYVVLAVFFCTHLATIFFPELEDNTAFNSAMVMSNDTTMVLVGFLFRDYLNDDDKHT